MSINSNPNLNGEKNCPNCGYKLIMIGSSISCTMYVFKQSPKDQPLSSEELIDQLKQKVHAVERKLNFILICFFIPFLFFYTVLPLIYLFTSE